MCFVRTEDGRKNYAWNHLWRQFLQHSSFMGEILKSLWRKYHLPRRLMLKFPSSALHHHIHETLTTPKATILPHLSVYPTFIWLAGPEISPEPKRAMLNILLSTEAEDTPMTSQSNIYIICKRKAWTVMLLLKQIKSRTLFMSFWDHNFPCPCPWLGSEHRGQRKCCWVCPLCTCTRSPCLGTQPQRTDMENLPYSGFGSEPWDLILHAHVVHPELASMSFSGLSCHGEHKGPVKGKSQAFTCLHGCSPLPYGGRDDGRTKILLVGRAGALWERLLCSWHGNKDTNSMGQAWLPWDACWKTKQHVRNAQGDKVQVRTIKTQRWAVGKHGTSHLFAMHRKGVGVGVESVRWGSAVSHCAPRKLLTCVFMGNGTNYLWSWDPV